MTEDEYMTYPAASRLLPGWHTLTTQFSWGARA